MPCRSCAIIVLLSALVLPAIAGCSRGVASVRGKVTYRGKPLALGTVYVAASDGAQYAGSILPDGTYRVDLVPPGNVKICVISPKPPMIDASKILGKKAPPRPAEAPDQADPKKWFAIPDKYGEVASSGLNRELKGGSTTYDIDLD